jgi:peroxiredoxin
MVLLETPTIEDKIYAPSFSLQGVDGKVHTLDSCKGSAGTVVMFICNHCPYVKAIIERLVEDCRLLAQNNIGCVAIMPNDTDKYPADSFERMKDFSLENGFTFPYVIDSSQNVAREYGAVCTPDIFGFNSEGVLQYRGRLDSAGINEVSDDLKKDLIDAMLLIADKGVGPEEQFPSMGCSIKWRE